MPPPRSLFLEASPPEILRSSQKDESYLNYLRKELTEILQRLLGNQTPVRVKTVSDVSSVILYYSLTTLLDNQTLGEEYVGLLQVDSSLRALPSKLARLSAILLQVFGPRLFSKATGKFNVWLRDPQNLPHMKLEAREKLMAFTEMVQSSAFWIGRLNLVLFYILGKYYHLSQRAAGIHFILTAGHLKTSRSRKTFQIIGVTALVHLTLMLVVKLFHHVKNSSSGNEPVPVEASLNPDYAAKNSTTEMSASMKCTLCWDQRVNPVCTPCGHLFCWQCVLHWLQTKQECPMCREAVQPSRIVPLLNYK